MHQEKPHTAEMPTMWFERDKEFLLKNYLLNKRLNGVIPLNKQLIVAAAKNINGKVFIDVLTLAVRICFSPKDYT